MKTKRFLDGLAYFLLGTTEGIVSQYKEVMNGRREIPISSCPTSFANMLYSGSGSMETEKDEALRFVSFVESLG